MKIVEDAPGMLRARLRDDKNFAVVLVVAEHADRAAFARAALAVKLRELDEACDARDRADALVARVTEECRAIAIHCERHDADLDAAISGNLRRAR